MRINNFRYKYLALGVPECYFNITNMLKLKKNFQPS